MKAVETKATWGGKELCMSLLGNTTTAIVTDAFKRALHARNGL